MRKRHLPLVKLPSSLDLTLYLIREELKITRLFHGLEALGVQDCSYQPHLAPAILKQLAADEIPDDLFEWFNDLLDRHAGEIDPEMESQTKHALEVYHALIAEMSRRYPDHN